MEEYICASIDFLGTVYSVILGGMCLLQKIYPPANITKI